MTACLYAQARKTGLSKQRIYSRRFVHPLHGLVRPADEALDLVGWVAAARLVLPEDAVATGLTALQLRGLDLGRPLPMTFATTTRRGCRRPEIRLLRRSHLDISTAIAGTEPALLEVAGSVGLLDAVAITDRLIRLRLLSMAQLADLSASAPKRVQVPLRLARPGAESVRETHLRLCLVLAGLPEPETQVTLRDEAGVIGRFDLGYRAHGVLLEYEGDQHRVDKWQWNRDVERVQRAQRLGYTVVRITAQLFADPWSQVLSIHAQLRRGGYRGPAPRRSANWAVCFGAGGWGSVLG